MLHKCTFIELLITELFLIRFSVKLCFVLRFITSSQVKLWWKHRRGKGWYSPPVVKTFSAMTTTTTTPTWTATTTTTRWRRRMWGGKAIVIAQTMSTSPGIFKLTKDWGHNFHPISTPPSLRHTNSQKNGSKQFLWANKLHLKVNVIKTLFLERESMFWFFLHIGWGRGRVPYYDKSWQLSHSVKIYYSISNAGCRANTILWLFFKSWFLQSSCFQLCYTLAPICLFYCCYQVYERCYCCCCCGGVIIGVLVFVAVVALFISWHLASRILQVSLWQLMAHSVEAC